MSERDDNQDDLTASVAHTEHTLSAVAGSVCPWDLLGSSLVSGVSVAMTDKYGLSKHSHFVEGGYRIILKALQKCLSDTFILLYLSSRYCSVPSSPDIKIATSFHRKIIMEC